MSKLIRQAILASGLLASISFSTRANAQTNVELIVDDSGSMAQKIVGGRKIDVAKQVFSEMIPDLPQDAQIAVRTYGRQRYYTKRDCSDMELLIPFGPNRSERVLPGVKALKPNGMTPIAASLQAAAKDFAGKEGQNNIIVLMSDGEEDCNGDPCAAAKAVHDAGIHLQVNVIGLHVGPKERTQLECVASAGGGKYYDAANARELKVAASEVKERIAAVPAPTAAPTPSEPNLLAPAAGGQVIAAPNASWQAAISGKESDTVGFSCAGGVQEAVFAFKNEQPATFSKFEIFIPSSGQWVKDFELLASDSVSGEYRSLGKFTTTNLRMMKSPYQEFTFPETTAKYLKFRILSSNGGDCSEHLTQIRLIGKLAPQPSGAAEPPKPELVNLLLPSAGGQLIAAPNADWQRAISGKDSDAVGFSCAAGILEGVFAFKDEQPATFSKFEILIPSSGQWVKDFELLASDSVSGNYRSLGKFTTTNTRMFKSPYQEFSFPETTAKYLKFRILSSTGGDCSENLTQIRLMGKPAPAQTTHVSMAAPPVMVNLLSPAAGGQVIAAPNPDWERVISGKDSDTVGFSCAAGVLEVVFAFKDQKPVTFFRFEILIPRTGQWLKDFELLASDSPAGGYRSLGKFTIQNLRLVKTPYQEFSFPETTAKYVKLRILSSTGGDCSESLTQLRIMGKPST